MRKILSIVIAVLMVSMMIPSMAFADAAISAEAVTGLVAGENFTYAVAVTNGATEATMTVNAKVFNFDGVGSAENVEATSTQPVVDGVATFTVNVSKSVPVTLDSNVKITAGSDSALVEFKIADRLKGDANGDGKVNSADATQILKAYAGVTTDGTYKAIAANANADTVVNSADATQVLKAYAGVDTDIENLGTLYLGGEVNADDFENIVTEDVTPDVPAKVVSPASGVYAYYQNGTVYYTFTAGENAESYAISVNGVAVELDDATATSGSFACANWNEDADNTISVVAKAEGAEDAEAATTTIIVADANGALAQWLNANGLNDVTITVYEIQ